jgi:hypothetical protein
VPAGEKHVLPTKTRLVYGHGYGDMDRERTVPVRDLKPVKDLSGPARPTAEELQLLADLAQRFGLPQPRRRRPRDDDGQPVTSPTGRGPTPLAGAAAAPID